MAKKSKGAKSPASKKGAGGKAPDKKAASKAAALKPEAKPPSPVEEPKPTPVEEPEATEPEAKEAAPALPSAPVPEPKVGPVVVKEDLDAPPAPEVLPRAVPVQMSTEREVERIACITQTCNIGGRQYPLVKDMPITLLYAHASKLEGAGKVRR